MSPGRGDTSEEGHFHTPASSPPSTSPPSESSAQRNAHRAHPSAPRTLFKWGIIDVLAQCEPDRNCNTCTLFPECAGKAKDPAGRRPGHVEIDDALRMKARASVLSWESEMLCLRPRRSDSVLPEFDPARHVRPIDPSPTDTWLGGMDFGFRSPTVFLWATLDDRTNLTIIDEHVESGLVLEDHLRAIAARPWPRCKWIGIDPAGHQTNSHTGITSAQVMRNANLKVCSRPSPIHLGLRLLRARLNPASGEPRLFIHPRCEKLIESLTKYRYPPNNPEATEPLKDGNDHAVDALRYLAVNLDQPYTAKMIQYAQYP